MEIISKQYKQELAKFAKQKNNINRLWNVNKETAKFLYLMVKTRKPENILEIGTSNGFSTFWLSIAAPNNTTIDTIEIDKDRLALAKENLKHYNNINFHHGMAENIIPALKKKFDFIFIDAGKIGYISYIKILLPKLNTNSIIIADSVISHAESVYEYLDFINQNQNMENIKLEIGDGLMVTFFRERMDKCQK